MPPDDEILELMEEHDLEKDEAERLQNLIDELGLDADDALRLLDEL
jgi:hypothetical protein